MFLGALLQRQNDSYKIRREDANKLRLAYDNIQDLENEISCFFDYQIEFSNKLIPTNGIKLFLNSELAYFLPQEIRESIKYAQEKIIEFNSNKTKNSATLKNIFNTLFGNKTHHINFIEPFILNTLMFINSKKYLWFGIKPNDKDIYSKFNKREITHLKSQLSHNNSYTQSDFKKARKKYKELFYGEPLNTKNVEDSNSDDS